MEFMFIDCSGLTSLGVSGWNTSCVTDMGSMFSGCSGLTSLDLSGWNTSKVSYASGMFSSCKTLNKVVVGEMTRLPRDSNFGSSYDHSLFTDTWACEEDGAKLTSSELADGVAHPGTWRRMRIDFSYTVNYAADSDDATGEMVSATSNEGDAFTFPKCKFYSLNYEFAGWKVAGDNLSASIDPSKIYQPGDVVEGGISHRGGTATLTAQWKPIDNSVDIEDGAFDITLRAGEAGVIDGLPAGTGYNVYEKTPAGYKLVSSSDTSGTIDPAGIKTAVFTNEVSNGEKSANASITALKTLDGEPATGGAFNFTLAALDGAPMPEGTAGGSLTVANGTGGAVNFGSITYDEAGTYCYTIDEVKGDDDGVTYDGKTVDATVEVKAADDGSLSADVTYDGKSSLPVFANKTKTVEPHYGSLTFTKKVEGAPESDAGKSFKFRIDWDTARESEEFTLAAGKSKTWKDLEPGLGYTITELDVPAGYKASGKVTGSIEADSEAMASITNTYTVKPKGSFTVSAKKTLEGRELKAGEFTFELAEVKADGTVGKTVATATNDGDGNVAFPSVAVTSAGEHRYRISEKAGSAAGITYDKRAYDLTVTARASQADDSKLDCSVKYEDGDILNAAPTFTNTYKAPEGSFTAKAVKKLDGRKLTADDKFTFELLKVKADGSDGEIVATVENDADGNVTFPSVTVVSAGEHRYRIREKAGSAAGITYDKRAYDLTVTARASQADDSKLECTVAYIGTDAAAEPPVFTNSYEAKGTFAAHATKSVKGADLKKDAYTFELLEVETDGSDGEVVATAKNDAEGNVTFGDVTVTSLGEHRYRMREVAGDEAGMAYDTAARDLTVTATDAGNGKLNCEVAYEGGAEPEFVNVFQKPGTFVARAHKALDGRDLKEGEFEFELVKVKDDGSDGEVVASAKNDATGNVVFGKLSVDAKGRYKYRIREKAGKDGSVIYDKTEYDLDVVATDDTDGNLSCQVVYGTPDHVVPTFTNNIKMPEGSFKVEATKKLEGRKLKAGEFSFELVKVKADGSLGKVVAAAKNGADGKVEFPTVELTGEGMRSYRIREAKGDAGGVTYDGKSYGLTVDAHMSEGDDAKLDCTVSYDGGSAPTFTNVYVAKGGFKAEATKVFEGRDLKAGEFSFELVDKDGKVVATAKNGADGKVEFPEVGLTAAGTYAYSIREKAGSVPGVSYDGNEYSLTVAAADNGDGALRCDVSYDGGSAPTFTNKYEAPKGSLTFTKKVEGAPESDAGRKFKFRVDWDSARDGEEFALAAGESKTWENLDPGLGYTITELDVPAGYKASGAVTGSIEADKQSKESITNVYTAKPEGAFVARATKTLKGRKLKDREFTFELVKVKSDGSDGRVVASAENDAAGNVTFPGVTVTSAGEYRYRIREKAGLKPGVIYDTAAHGLTVTAVDNGDDKLECTVSYDGGEAPTFTNRYEAKGSFRAQATKRLEGRELKDKEFPFELVDKDGNVAATAKNGADGKIEFPEVELTAAGTYAYGIREVAGDDSDMVYDTAVRSLTVTATDSGDGTLKCEVAYEGGVAAEFVNVLRKPGTFVARA